MGLSQQEIDALKAEDAQLAALQGTAQPAQRLMTFPPAGGVYPDDTPFAQALAPYINPSAAPAGATPDSGRLPQIQVGENVNRPLGGPDQPPAPTPATQAPAALTPEQVAALKAEDAQLAEQEAKAAAPKEESRISKLWEKIRPTKTEAEGGVIDPDLEKTPDWTGAIPWSHPDQAARMVFGMGIATPEEAFDIFKEQLPDAKIEKAGKFGQYIKIKPAGSDETYTWKPGMRASDFARAAVTAPIAAGGTALAAAMLPAAAPAIIPAVIGGAGMLEIQKANAGGGFSPGNIVGAALVHGGMEGLASIARGVRSLLPGAADAGAAVGAEGAAIQPNAASAEAPPVPQMSQPELAANMAAAGRGKASGARAALEQMRLDPELTSAAKQLPSLDGQPLIESLAPEHLSRSPHFRRLAAAATGAAENTAAAKKGLGATWNELLDVAGTPGNQGALETSAKDAISRRLEAAQRLVDEIYSAIDGADAVAASETSAAKPAVQGLVARSAPAPVPEFNALLEKTKSDLGGVLPKSVQKLRGELFSGAADGIPTRAMVNRVRMQIGRDIGSGGKKYGIGLAHDMYEALDAAYIASAEQTAPEAAALIRSGKQASQYLRSARDLTTSVLGVDAERSLTDRIAAEVANLPHGNTATFAKVMSVTPEAMRPQIAKHALRQFVDRAKSLNVQELNDWFRAMQGNKPSWNALKMYIGDDLAKNLESTAKISANVEAAMNAVKARQPFTEPWNIPGLAWKGLKLMGANRYGGPIGAGVYAISDRILANPGPLSDAVGEWLASPTVRAYMTAEAKGAVSPGMLRSMMENGLFRKVMTLANIPVHSRQAFLAATKDQQQEAK